jgi:hypothetical protein
MTISDLKAAEYNPRMISEKNLTGLKFSLSEFGDLSGIVFNKRTGNLVTGHQRTKAIQEEFGDLMIFGPDLGDSLMFELPNGDSFHVRVVDWPLEKEMAANVAANNPALQGAFTVDLQQILMDIQSNQPEQYSSLNLDELVNQDELYKGLRQELRGYSPLQSSTDEYELGGKFQEAIRYILIFDTLAEKQEFEAFIDRARQAYPYEPTVANSVLNYIKDKQA